DAVADRQLAARRDTPAVDLHVTALDRLGRDRPRLREPCGPQPLVNPDGWRVLAHASTLSPQRPRRAVHSSRRWPTMGPTDPPGRTSCRCTAGAAFRASWRWRPTSRSASARGRYGS